MFRFILADLKRLWAGSIVIVILIMLATALGVAVTLEERALRLGSARASEKFDLVIGAPGSETQLVLSSVFLQAADLPLMDGDILPDLQADPRVAWAAPIGFGDSYEGYPIVGTTSELIENTTPGFSQGDNFTHLGEAVTGSAVDLAIGDTIKPMHGTVETGGHTHDELAYTVTGRADPTGTPWDRAIFVPIEAVWKIHGMEAHEADGHDHEAAGHDHDEQADDHEHAAHDDHDEAGHEEDHHHIDPATPVDEHWHEGETPGLPAILVKPKSIADAYKLRQDYRGDQTLAVFPAEVLTKLYATLGDAKQVLTAIAAGAQVLVAAALMLVTVIHVSQRRREIGALRAFGAPRGAVFTIVWGELFLLVALGIALGYAAGLAAALAIARSITAERGVSLPVEFTRADLGSAAVLIAVAAVLSALPALIAYRQSPAAALKS
ncbi:FtsX-like permease family protein [Martelella mediterranea]|uniref:Acidobacterial duplicated orphan permease n=1 Tax=Martelella mediterranea DSM 17316 TaxID=1122214 RepID=A0A1U9YZR4_9HYPH|nr:FtsX-like permease family protein [Martelella mediterranea]AQZ50852.1 acidobacterial duplicated orphan permease [Martelella mediterranea DSM 17316]